MTLDLEELVVHPSYQKDKRARVGNRLTDHVILTSETLRLPIFTIGVPEAYGMPKLDESEFEVLETCKFDLGNWMREGEKAAREQEKA